MELTDDQIRELLALAEKATPGPWFSRFKRPLPAGWLLATVESRPDPAGDLLHPAVCDSPNGDSDAQFIAAMREAGPALAEEVLRLRALLLKAETAYDGLLKDIVKVNVEWSHRCLAAEAERDRLQTVIRYLQQEAALDTTGPAVRNVIRKALRLLAGEPGQE